MDLALVTYNVWCAIKPNYRDEVVVSNRVQSMDKMKVFKNLTECKQKTDVKLNCQCYVATFETIKLCANKTDGVK